MLDKRSNEPEIMDDLQLGGQEMYQTLKELEVINNYLGGHKVVLDALDKLVAKHKDKLPQPLHITDIGCGGGDTLLNIAKWAKNRNIAVKLTGVDANNYIVQVAQERCSHFPFVEVEQHDVFSDSFAQHKYDVLVCSLFCHHFTDPQLVKMFSQLYQQAQMVVIINDLHRHWFAYHSIKLLTALFSKSYLVKHDGPLSVWRAFKRRELNSLVQKAGIAKYSLHWKWAFRWQLLLEKS
ncbi:methyltransferase domain-containing protein [Pontibacter diazotrophicus]|uniref:Methyltransferase domain-containing protein n=1 Tax=Pontibacter diazotrophicus TaxID=1400979 RepID=A0A3D8L1S7_9BACT|nr:methyltransferase domain-containing protein [Pontibacter diazotrophicus]RDV11313.1 methyltransferase domain-containing protein [Pontibacter diazotrophicus]